MIINFKKRKSWGQDITTESEWTMKNVKVWNLCDMKKLLKCSGTQRAKYERMLPIGKHKRKIWNEWSKKKTKLSDDDELSLNLHLNDYNDVNLAVVFLENVPNCLHLYHHPPPTTCFSALQLIVSYLCYISFRQNCCCLKQQTRSH